MAAELAELKRSLKKWESAFVTVHRRKPGRNDINDAPKDIQDTYLQYSKLKKVQPKIEDPNSDGKQKTSQGDECSSLPDTEAENQPDTEAENKTDTEAENQPDTEAENQTGEMGHMVQSDREARAEVWGAEFNRKSQADPVEDSTTEKKRSGSLFLKNITDKMFQQSVMLGAKKKSNSPYWKKPDTPHPGKVLSRNPFAEPLTSPSFDDSLDSPEDQPCTDGVPSIDGNHEETESSKGTDSRREDMGIMDTHQGHDAANSPKLKTSTNSFFAKALKVTRISSVKSTSSDVPEVYLGRSKLKQKVLPQGLSALVGKHRSQTGLDLEQDYDEVDGDSAAVDDMDTSVEDDAGTGKHAWDMPVKSLIIDDMIKSKPSSKTTKKSVISGKGKDIVKTVSSNTASELTNFDKNKEKENIYNADDLEQTTDTNIVQSPEKGCAKTKKRPMVAEASTVKKSSEDDSDKEEVVRKPVKRSAASRKRKAVIEESPEKTNTDTDATDLDVEDEDDVAEKKKRKAKAAKPAAKKRKIEASAAVDDEGGGSGVPNKPIKRAAPRSKPVSNDNFIRLNMKVKTYKRKGRHLTGPQYKRKMWKEKMAARSKSYGDACFKCGKPGHWANKCPGGQYASRYDKEPVQDEDFPSMQEAAQIARGIRTEPSREPKPRQSTVAESPSVSHPPADKPDESGEDVPDDVELDIQTEVVRSRQEPAVAPPAMEPLIQCNSQEELSETPDFVKKGLKKFGYDCFRPGQEEAVMRILCGLSTLVVLSTGGGKSLCYQLPAYLYSQATSCFTLVISPLVSLMEDQVTGLPPGVTGVCLHTNMTATQREKVLGAVKEGRAQFLLVSPEAIAGGSMTLIGAMATLPPVAFVCIDESHCLSEWSHNFRPSYLRLCKVLQEKLGIRCFLGLTATATMSTAADVSRHLKISNFKKAMVRGSPVPSNLLLSVSRDENREQALVGLLQGERFCHLESIIIYCTRRDQTDKVATIIRTCLNKGPPLQAGKAKKKKEPKLEWDAESYHAGLSAAQRKRVQNAFMSGRLRVVVATVAFGMGLDKADVRGVVHYNMPKSFEGYVQEIGRAGRDGRPAHCHLFLDPEGKDVCELRRHTYANTVDYRTLKRLVQKVFPACRCRDVHERHAQAVTEMTNTSENKSTEATMDDNMFCDFDDVEETSKAEPPKPRGGERLCPGHERSLPIEQTVMELDVKEEGISTLLCYLELHDGRWLEVLSHVYHHCKIQCYGGPGQLQIVSKKCPPVAVAIAKARSQGKSFNNSNTVEFPVVEISDTMGWDSGPVKKELKLLQWNFNTGTTPSRSGILVEFSELAYHFRSPGDFTAEEIDDVLQFLHERVQRQERSELAALARLYAALKSVSHKNHWMCADDIDMAKNDKLKAILNKYFDDQENPEDPREIGEEEAVQVDDFPVGQVISDVRQFSSLYGQEHTLTGRVVARIFHGIPSPCYPATTWGRVRRFWRSHLSVDFNELVKIATKELISMRQ